MYNILLRVACALTNQTVYDQTNYAPYAHDQKKRKKKTTNSATALFATWVYSDTRETEYVFIFLQKICGMNNARMHF